MPTPEGHGLKNSSGGSADEAVNPVLAEQSCTCAFTGDPVSCDPSAFGGTGGAFDGAAGAGGAGADA